MYFSTGNAGPVLGGGVRPGDNLFTASIVAVDVDTGEYRWHFQEVHHDIWDYDAPSPTILYDAEVDGETARSILAEGILRKDGAGREERPVEPPRSRAGWTRSPRASYSCATSPG